jgi:hypothetical protein
MCVRTQRVWPLVQQQSPPDVDRARTLEESHDGVDESPGIPRLFAHDLQHTDEAGQGQANAYPKDKHRDETQVECQQPDQTTE